MNTKVESVPTHKDGSPTPILDHKYGDDEENKATHKNKDFSIKVQELNEVEHEGGSEVQHSVLNDQAENNSPEHAPEEPIRFSENEVLDSETAQQEVHELTAVEKFFHDYWNKWMAKYKLIFIGISVVWLGLAVWRAALFKPAKDALKRLSDDHEISVISQSLKNDYHSALNTGNIEVYIIWGLKGLDRSDTGKWEPDNLGKIIYDDSFNLAPVANQQRILDICSDLKKRSLVSNQAVTCWLQDFVTARNGGNPVPEVNFYTELEQYLKTTLGQNQYNDNLIGYVGGKLLFMKIKALTPEATFQGYSILYPVYEAWEALKDEYNSKSPKGVNNAFQTAGYNWAWLITEEEMVRGAIQGILISLGFALAVLIASTLNIVISLYAVF